jgi:hypothetical protein
MKAYICVVFISITCLCTNTLLSYTLLDRAQLAQKGDLVVFDLKDSLQIIEIAAKDEKTTELRIIGATKDILSRHNFSSPLQWHSHGCPDMQFEEYITIEGTSTIQSSLSCAQWLTTLLKLDLYKIPQEARKRRGSSIKNDEIDLRSLWNPPITLDGNSQIEQCEAFSTKWPEDGSQMSSRMIILYFPTSQNLPQALPFWIESPSSSFHVAVLDSRKGPSN